MNNNEQQPKETTTTDGLHSSVGFPGFKGEGYIQPLDQQLDAMEKNGFEVDKTDKGIIITPKSE